MAGVAWRAWDSGVFSVGRGDEYHAWHSWPNGGGPVSLIHSAILAANAHNTQPWRFALSDGTVTVFAHRQRHLGSFDPFRREMQLSIGCALENLVHAARAQGLHASIDMLPGPLTVEPSERGVEPVAIVRLAHAEAVEDDLFRAIPHRHTHRGAYRAGHPVPVRVVDEMYDLAAAMSVRLYLFTAEKKKALGGSIVAATEAIVADRQMAIDNARWFRFHPREVRRRRDGLTLDTTVVPPLLNAAAKMMPPSPERANRQWLIDTRDVHVATAPLLGAIAVRDLYDRPTALVAGRLWQRLHLLMTARGLVAQPLNQPAERVDRDRELNDVSRTADALATLTGDSDWHPTFIFRAGYASHSARLSPRRSVEDVIVA